MENATIANITELNNSIGALFDIPQGYQTWFWVVSGILAIIIMLGNGLVMYLVTCRPRLRRTGNWFILSLSIADFSVGFFIIPTHLSCTFLFSCMWDLQQLFYEFILFISVGCLCTLTLDRYIVITRPLHYNTIMTRRRCLVAIGTSWSVPGVITLLPMFWRFGTVPTNVQNKCERVYRAVVIFAIVLLPIFFLFVTYAKILTVVRRHRKQTSSLRQQVAYNFRRGDSMSRRSVRSAVRVLGAMILLCAFCWVLSAYRSLCVYFGLCNVALVLQQVSRLLLFLNSALNPLVYSLLKEDIRHELSTLLKHQ